MNTRTLRLSGGLLLLATALLASGCRTNHLPDYAHRREKAHVVSVAPDGPNISVGSEETTSLISIATDVATLGVSADLARKFAEGTTPEEVSDQMADVFTAELDRSFDWALQPDAKSDHDTRIEVRITEYGLVADSPSSPAYFRMSIDARMVFRPESKLIWEYSETYLEPVNPVDIRAHASGNPHSAAQQTANAFNAGVNLALLSKLTPDALRAVFLNLARKAGSRLVSQIRDDIAD